MYLSLASRASQAAWLFHYYLGSGRRGDRVRKIMAGGVVAGQNAHMELVKKEEDKARQEAEGDTVTQGAGSGVDSKVSIREESMSRAHVRVFILATCVCLYLRRRTNKWYR